MVLCVPLVALSFEHDGMRRIAQLNAHTSASKDFGYGTALGSFQPVAASAVAPETDLFEEVEGKGLTTWQGVESPVTINFPVGTSPRLPLNRLMGFPLT